MKMSQRRKDLRPREKLQAKGAQSLSDYELLMAIIGSGNKQADVSKIARDTLEAHKKTWRRRKLRSALGRNWHGCR
jgi:DNA repair protein RadC